MKENKITPIERKIIIAQAVFVIVCLGYIVIANSPNQVYPLQGMSISEPDFNFEIENGEEVLISVDKEFTNPFVLSEGEKITLPPGTYYWKVRGKFRESEVKSFEIVGQVGLDIKKRAENYELENSGNVEMNVTKEKDGKVSSMTMDVGEITEVEEDNSIYEGEQIWRERK